MTKDHFDQATHGNVQERKHRDHPKPEELIEKGITTEDTLAHQAMRPPIPLRPEPTPDDPSGWRTAIANADREHADRMQKRKIDFRERFAKARQDFDTARNYRGDKEGYQR